MSGALRRSARGLIWAAGLVALAGCHRATPPNIILYVVDTLRADALGCYGNATVQTPAMDRVAREGMRFARAYANASWTRPSMGTLLTGEYPKTHGAVGRQDALRTGATTLSSRLRAAGYHTAAVFANPSIGAAFGFAEGFESFIELYPARFIHDQSLPHDQVGTADSVVNRTIDWLRRRPSGPFFLLVFTVDPHAPYEPPAPYSTMYDPGYTGSVDGSIKTLYMPFVPAPRDVQHLRALYHGEVTFNDAQLQRLLDELDRSRLTESTLLMITADHGEEFYEHGHQGHGHSLYEELIRVPLIARWPRKIAASSLHDGAVQLVDLYPTLLRVAGAAAASGPGRDLTDVLLGRHPDGVASLVFAEEHLDDHNLRAVMLDRRKLIYDAARSDPLVFDLRSDPGELQPIPGMPAQDLTATMSKITMRDRPPSPPARRKVRATDLPDATREAMIALGYGDPARP